MSWFDTPTVVVQGITGHHGAFHTQGMLDAGTHIVAGVTPGKAGRTVHGIPVYSSVGDAMARHPRIDTSVLFVPAQFAKDAAFDAISSGVKQLVIITEGIPVHDTLAIREFAAKKKVAIIGPNCPGIIVPGSHKLGIIAQHITSPGDTAIISRSGTLTYELADALTKRGLGQSIIIGIGGDPVPGTNFVDALRIVERHQGTKRIVMVGEIGSMNEQLAADYVAAHITKPVYGLVVGHSAPAGQTFGHAGAIIGSDQESASAKTTHMGMRGIEMSNTLEKLIDSIAMSSS